MKQFFDIMLIAFCWVFMLDVSGFWLTFSATVKGWLTNGLIKTPFEFKPFSCSLCMTFWTGIAYLLITGAFSIASFAVVCLAAFLTPTIKDALFTIRDLLTKMFNVITDTLC